MSIAELHGKLSPDEPRSVHDGMEDLLTSDVFGTMLYVGWHSAFQMWLSDAVAAPGAKSNPSLALLLPPSAAAKVFYSFWPRLPNNREPDVAMWIEAADQPATLIVIEVKYRSGLSGESQLVDEAQGLMALTDAHLQQWAFRPSVAFSRPLSFRKVLLYVTADSVLPTADLALDGTEAWPVPVFWLSWRWLLRYLDQSDSLHSTTSSSLLIEDLGRLLARKRLRDFNGFGYPPPAVLPRAGFYTDRRIARRRWRE